MTPAGTGATGDTALDGPLSNGFSSTSTADGEQLRAREKDPGFANYFIVTWTASPLWGDREGAGRLLGPSPASGAALGLYPSSAHSA
jgi:hypothetical protein